MQSHILTNSSDPTTAKTTTRGFSLSDAHHLVFERFIFPVTFYRFTSGNNTLVWLEGATTLTATITAGNYNATSFEVMLKSVMETESAANGVTDTYTVSVDDDGTGSITISALATNIGLQLASYSELARILGFSASNTAATAQTITGSYPCMLTIPYIYFCANGSFNRDQYFDAEPDCRLVTIPITYETGSLFYTVSYAPSTSAILKLASSRSRTIEHWFEDDFGNTLNFNNGVYNVEFQVC